LSRLVVPRATRGTELNAPPDRGHDAVRASGRRRVLAAAGELRRPSVGLAGTDGEFSRWCVAKPKRKLTAQQRAEKKRRRQEYVTIFIRGKQKRVRRPATIEGISVEEFVHNNADPLWYHQNESWDEIDADKENE